MKDLDEAEELILQHLFKEENVEELLVEFEPAQVRALIDKLGLEMPECLADDPELEEDEDEEEEDALEIVGDPDLA